MRINRARGVADGTCQGCLRQLNAGSSVDFQQLLVNGQIYVAVDDDRLASVAVQIRAILLPVKGPRILEEVGGRSRAGRARRIASPIGLPVRTFGGGIDYDFVEVGKLIGPKNEGYAVAGLERIIPIVTKGIESFTVDENVPVALQHTIGIKRRLQ